MLNKVSFTFFPLDFQAKLFEPYGKAVIVSS